MYGKKVQDRMMGDLNYGLAILPLWGTLKGQFIALDHESNRHSAGEVFRVRRTGVFAAHPQRLFYRYPKRDIKFHKSRN